ncbi:conjugal transfer protein MobB [Pontibacter saemangeumensis]|uniref:Conjugal transfer protein MobB n=1 Tax=Pontibacter saemangeumensis TaxID=1084525 RepID=A0ABP8LJ47_9BACT
MVAVIKTGSSIHRILNYNEQKVKTGAAECIMAANYPKDVEDLTLLNKLNRLLHQVALNENVTRNSVHISLNFDPSENHSHERLREIAATYMQRIGFGDQPYLVYQHHDAGHPHIHIITIKVRADGSRIDTQNIGRNQSERARKEIELTYGLVKAEDSKQRQTYELKPVNAQKVQYGRSETKRAVANVLDTVLTNYKYTSLPELNAVLQQYNVSADRGSENSRIYLHNGLTYRILDESGNKIGTPIKASDFYSKPTLKYLKAKFRQNEAARQPHKARMKNAIDLSFLKQPNYSLMSFIKALEKDGISTVLRQNAEGLVYGITYVDHRTKSVFNGSALGKRYSAKAIQERCEQGEQLGYKQDAKASKKVQLTQQQSAQKTSSNPATSNRQSATAQPFPNMDTAKTLDILLQPEQASDYVPHQLKKKGKKKRRKRTTGHLKM